VTASGRAAAEKVKQKAHRARAALREAGEELARAPAVSALPSYDIVTIFEADGFDGSYALHPLNGI